MTDKQIHDQMKEAVEAYHTAGTRGHDLDPSDKPPQEDEGVAMKGATGGPSQLEEAFERVSEEMSDAARELIDNAGDGDVSYDGTRMTAAVVDEFLAFMAADIDAFLDAYVVPSPRKVKAKRLIAAGFHTARETVELYGSHQPPRPEEDDMGVSAGPEVPNLGGGGMAHREEDVAYREHDEAAS